MSICMSRTFATAGAAAAAAEPAARGRPAGIAVKPSSGCR